MIKIIASIVGCLICFAAWAQTLQPSGGGSGSIVVGTAPITGSATAAGCVLFRATGGVAGCDAGFTYAGAGGLVRIPVNGASNTADVGSSTSNGVAFRANVVDIVGTGTASMTVSSTGIQANNLIAISNGSTATVAPDVGVSRSFPGILSIGNGTQASSAGGIITGTASLVSLTTGTNADFLCLAANGTVFLQTSACTISSLRFKPDWKPYADNALKKVSGMQVGTFHLDIRSRDPNSESLQAGLNAENVAAIAPECAIYEDDMKTPKSYRQECVIGLLVKAIQQLKHDR